MITKADRDKRFDEMPEWTVGILQSIAANLGCSIEELATWPPVEDGNKRVFIGEGKVTTHKFTGSMSEQIRLLNVGQCCAKVEPLRFNTPSGHNDVISLRDMRDSLRNSLSSAIVRAMQTTNGTYSIEISETSMPSGNIYVTAVVTRTS